MKPAASPASREPRSGAPSPTKGSPPGSSQSDISISISPTSSASQLRSIKVTRKRVEQEVTLGGAEMEPRMTEREELGLRPLFSRRDLGLKPERKKRESNKRDPNDPYDPDLWDLDYDGGLVNLPDGTCRHIIVKV